MWLPRGPHPAPFSAAEPWAMLGRSLPARPQRAGLPTSAPSRRPPRPPPQGSSSSRGRPRDSRRKARTASAATRTWWPRPTHTSATPWRAPPLGPNPPPAVCPVRVGGGGGGTLARPHPPPRACALLRLASVSRRGWRRQCRASGTLVRPPGPVHAPSTKHQPSLAPSFPPPDSTIHWLQAPPCTGPSCPP